MGSSIKNIVLVHGAFADGSSWAKVIPRLTARGIKSIAVQNPLSSLADDVETTVRMIEMQDGPVLLAGHSWGGGVITEAGNHPQVAGLVYVAAGAPDSGKSFNDWWQDYPPMPGTAEIEPCGEEYLVMSREGVRKYFAGDIPQEEADVVFATQGPLAARCFDDLITTAAWRAKPSWYIVAENDQTIPPKVQRDSAQKLGAKTLKLKSSHVPMLSRPDAVADFLADAADSLSF
ncbi:alpha/beta hydrolase [Sodalis sp. dw_96]|uniref:alpha/beta fold hydrolase n=1 Tax=Sodalis sp. dw_96 TaxID=2719794 RepID=UPI001BD303E8|nr:alpha/beta hydrolase [Sodalis sp. dw_96]